MKTLAERLDEEEKALDEEEGFRLRIKEALERSQKHVADVRKRARQQCGITADDLRIVIR